MKRLSLVAITIIIGAYFLFSQSDDSARIGEEHLATKAPPSSTRTTAAINLPKRVDVRTPAASPVDAQETNAYLASWWSLYSPSQRKDFALKLIEKDSLREIYQVTYKNVTVESLTVNRNLERKREVEPFPVFQALEDTRLMPVQEVEERLRASNDQINSLRWIDKIWSPGGNQTLIPAYQFSVTIKDQIDSEVWIVDAQTADIISTNSFSRH